MSVRDGFQEVWELGGRRAVFRVYWEAKKKLGWHERASLNDVVVARPAKRFAVRLALGEPSLTAETLRALIPVHSLIELDPEQA